MKMGCTATLIGLALCLVGVGWYVLEEFIPGIDEKAAYAALQGIEMDHRNLSVKTPIVIVDGGDAGEVLGLRNPNKNFPYTWISLNHVGPDGSVLVVSDGDKILDYCGSIQASLKQEKPDPVVVAFLAHVCQP
jgi:hypothetical protein